MTNIKLETKKDSNNVVLNTNPDETKQKTCRIKFSMIRFRLILGIFKVSDKSIYSKTILLSSFTLLKVGKLDVL